MKLAEKTLIRLTALCPCVNMKCFIPIYRDVVVVVVAEKLETTEEMI